MGRCDGFSVSTRGIYNVFVRDDIDPMPTSCHVRSIRRKGDQAGHYIHVDVKSRTSSSQRVVSCGASRSWRSTTPLDFAPASSASATPRRARSTSSTTSSRASPSASTRSAPTAARADWRGSTGTSRTRGTARLHQAEEPEPEGQGQALPPTEEPWFRQLLDYTDDVDLAGKLTLWEEFYSAHRLRDDLGRLTPHDVLKQKMASSGRVERGREGHDYPLGQDGSPGFVGAIGGPYPAPRLAPPRAS